MAHLHCTAAILAALLVLTGRVATAGQAPPPVPAVGEATFVVFMGNREVGREQVNLARTASGWTITSTGRLVAPVDLANKRFEITYAPDWQPIELEIDAAVGDAALALSTSFALTSAINEITRKGVTSTKNDQITARTVVLPNNFYAAYEALAVRLASSAVGAQIPVYIAPEGEIRMTVTAITASTYKTPGGVVEARRFSLTVQNPGKTLAAEVTIDARNRFARLEIDGGALSVARQDLAVVAARQQTLRNPTDADVSIPATGFGLAGTITTPPAQGRLEHPAIVLVADAGAIERDGAAAAVPIFAQLAGQLADRGFVVLRYDKRGVGQSGGRLETVTLQDYADDAVSAVKWLARRKDVDDRRIAVLGHGEGAAVALLAAAREKRIAAVVTLAGMGTTGRDLVLEQQQRLLDASKVSEAERIAKVELQKQILGAVTSGQGWEKLPAEVSRAADTPLYRSQVLFDPVTVLPRVRQPILILHGAADTVIPTHHADRLAALAQARKNSPVVEVRRFAALDHLMLPATAAPGDGAQAVSAEVAAAIAAWLPTVAR